MVEKSYLIQRYARLKFSPQYSIIGYSMAGEETVIQVPELNVCFDVGRAPQFALSSDYMCITHGHMDHLAGLAYYLSQKHFQGMKPGTVLLPGELEGPANRLLEVWRDIERQKTPFTLVPMKPDQLYEIRRDFGIRALATHHGGGSLGYCLVSIREKLKPEYLSLSGEELARLREAGTNIQYRVEVPLVTFLGDTSIGPVFDHPDVINAEVLITECTFFDPDHKARAKAGKHLHVEQLARVLPKLKNKHVVISHVSRRTGIRRAKSILRKTVFEELLGNIHFLMDFEHAKPAGEIDEKASGGAEG
jgi:ribonuclease Z